MQICQSCYLNLIFSREEEYLDFQPFLMRESVFACRAMNIMKALTTNLNIFSPFLMCTMLMSYLDKPRGNPHGTKD